MNASIEAIQVLSKSIGPLTADNLSSAMLEALPIFEKLGVDRSSLSLRLRDAFQMLMANDRAALIHALRDFSTLCRPDWDEEGALPITSNAIEEAVNFVENLPQHVSLPEATPDPRGRIGLEWHVDRHKLLVVTFGGTGSIAFTAMLGRDDYLSGLMPCAEQDRVLELLNRLLTHGNPR